MNLLPPSDDYLPPLNEIPTMTMKPSGLQDIVVDQNEPVIKGARMKVRGANAGKPPLFPSVMDSQAMFEKLDESDKAVQILEEGLRDIHRAVLCEHKRTFAEESQLIEEQSNMEIYVEQLEQILEMRAAYDAKLREQLEQYRDALNEDDLTKKQLEDMMFA